MIRSACKILVPTFLLFAAMLAAPVGLPGFAASASPGCGNYAYTPWDNGYQIVAAGGASCSWYETRTLTVKLWRDISFYPDQLCAQAGLTAYATDYYGEAPAGNGSSPISAYSEVILGGDATQSNRATRYINLGYCS